MDLTLEEIVKARQILQGTAYKTGLVKDAALTELSHNQVYLKMENLQRTGSFKLRGAYNCIARLSEAEKQCGVIAASAGNHAQGVALAAQAYGIPATIVMPKHAPLSKVKATKKYGAEVILHGDIYDEAYAKACELQKQTGAKFIHPFDDPLVMAGQGTIALEIIEDLPEVDVIVVPVGGGGLISGIAAAVKGIKPEIQVIGVQTKNVPSMAESFKQHKMICVDGAATIADGIAVKKPGERTFAVIEKYVDDIVTVDEEEIAAAILLLLEKTKAVVEGAGAASVAAVLHGLSRYQGKNIVAILSGGNIDVNFLSRIIDKGLMKTGRKVFCNTVIPDKPGTLWHFLELISNSGANILSVSHNRQLPDVPLGYASVEIELETADEEQIKLIQNLLKTEKYQVFIR